MSILTSYREGSLGGAMFDDMPAVSGSYNEMTQAGSMLKAYREGSLGCACSGAGGLGSYLEKFQVLATWQKAVVGVGVAGALYFVGKKAKLIPNRRRRSRRSRRR